ncbi:MAG TPA: glycosyltransferase, partial [Longimicrobium sp.]|uniref:glycosyltransferase n=1 Tax=Longimicrobium sp. TaxID=2029185 RepID=UPI002EDA1250
EVELLVLYGAARESNRAWRLEASKGYPYQVLPGLTLAGSLHLNAGMNRAIRRFAPGVAVLTGSYTMPAVQGAAAALRVRRVPWVYWGEELLHGPAPLLRRMLRDALRRPLRAARGVLAIGSRARESYARAGIPRERIADFRYYANTEAFALAPAAREAARARVRGQLGLQAGAAVFLFVGQLIPRKGVDTLLRAAAHAPGATVVVAGNGPEGERLRALAAELGVADRVRFAGFVQPAELPGLFAAADAFVLPAHSEGWGVVVPEAMAAGLPVLATDRVNAAADLVADGESGFRFPVHDHAALGARMEELCARPERRAAMGRAARTAVGGEAPAVAARRLVALLEAARAGAPLAAL